MKTLIVSLALVLGLVATAHAQTNPAFTTTTTAAITATQRNIPLTAVTFAASVSSTLTLRAGWGIQIDGEYMVVAPTYVSGLSVPVERGMLGTSAQPHVSGVTAILGPPGVFNSSAPGENGSSCPAAPAQYLIQVQTVTGNVYLCRWIASVGRVWTATNSLLLTYNSLTVR